MELFTGAEALIHFLTEKGIKTIFGYPGGANLPIFDALRNSSIHLVLARHEQGAIHMADSYARVTGQPGVCLVTSGPGATNLITGLANAFMDSIPLIALTGQIEKNLVGSDAFQEVDCLNITIPVTKHNELLLDVEELIPALASAFYIADSGRKGPVLIDLPFDILTAKYIPDFSQRREHKGYNPTLHGHIGQIKRALRLLKKAKKPLFLFGGGIFAANAIDEIISLVSKTQIPAVHTFMGKGILPYHHPLLIGMIGIHGNIEANRAVEQADVIFAIGTRFNNRTIINASTFAPMAQIIQIDIDPAEIGKSIPIDIPVVGDIKIVITDLLNELEKRPLQQNQLWITTSNKEHTLPTKDQALWIGKICEKISSIDQKLHITTDVGRHQMWAIHHCTNSKHLPLITSGGLGTMGFGLPAAIGAWFADQATPVINITGDGSFLMNMQEFVVAVEYNIPLIIILINDGRLGMIRELQDTYYESHYFAHELKQHINYIKLAEGMGGNGIDVVLPEEILPSIQKALSAKKPTIINFNLYQLEQNAQS